MARFVIVVALLVASAMAGNDNDNNSNDGCGALPNWQALQSALAAAVQPSGGPSNGGFNLHMWATIVSRKGFVCNVARSGATPGDQWPGSRVISAQKANTANAFCLPGLALSTANLWAPNQPGGSLFGLQFSNPVDTSVAYAGVYEKFGTSQDPLKGKRIGGVNVFGGGLGLYDSTGTLLGAIGCSGDSSCADHNICWRIREQLNLDYVPSGVGFPAGTDGIIYNPSAEFGHPDCGHGELGVSIAIGAGGIPPP